MTNGTRRFDVYSIKITRWPEYSSIFAWKINVNVEPYASPIYPEGALCGVSAKSAAIFEDCNEYKSNQHDGYRELWITNIGVKIRARVLGSSLYAEEGRGYILPLNCTMHGQSPGFRLC
jgi:hypothetical protein